MHYSIIVENTEDLKLLKQMFSNAMKKIDNGTWLHEDNIESIQRLHAGIEAATAHKARTPTTEAMPVPNLCKEHTKYEAMRPPRTDCKSCWAAYKKLNPLKYTTARKRYLRKAAVQ